MLSTYGEEGANAVAWEIVDSLDDRVSLHMRDQLEAAMRDSPGEAHYIVIYMGTDAEIERLEEG